MMNMTEFSKRVTKILKTINESFEQELTRETDIAALFNPPKDAAYYEGEGFDSLDLIEFIMMFEDEFHIELPDDVAYSARTLADFKKLVDERSRS